MARTRRRRASDFGPLVHMAARGIVCDVHVRSINSFELTATYEVAITNQSGVDVSCRLYGMDSTSHSREYGMLSVSDESASNSFFSVPLSPDEGWQIYVEVFGDGVNLFAEALQPKAELPEPRWPRLVAIAVVAASIGLLAEAYFLNRPTVLALIAPSSVAPGPVTAVYAVGDGETARYTARIGNGPPFAHGNLAAVKGEVSVTIPQSAAGHTVELSIEAGNELGRTTRTANFEVDAGSPAIATDARIGSLSARREPSSTHTDIVVSYTARGERGILRLIDSQGLVLTSLPYSRAGTSRIPLDLVTAEQPLRAELRVEQGQTHASYAVEIPREHEDDPTAGVAAVIDRDTTSPRVAEQSTVHSVLPEASDPIVVSSRVVAGEMFKVAVPHPIAGLHLAFLDELRAVIDEVDVAPGVDVVAFSAPASPTVATYYVAATVGTGDSIKTTVQALRVYPK